MIAYIAIGNSDDKLSQRQWAAFQIDVRFVIRDMDLDVHGSWHSYADSIYQNATFCVEFREDQLALLKHKLSLLAGEYQQNSIAFNIVQDTEFLEPA